MLFIDTETRLIRPGVPAPECVCVQLAQDLEEPVILPPDEGAERVKNAIIDGETICGHALNYDIGVLIAHTRGLLTLPVLIGLESNQFIDTKVAARLLDIQRGTGRKYSLEALCDDYKIRRKEDPHGWRLRFSELQHLQISEWPAEARNYARGDVQCTRELLRALLRAGLQKEEAIRQSGNYIALQFLTLRGVSVDLDRLKQVEQQVFETRHAAREQLCAAGIYRVDGTKDLEEIRHRVAIAYEKEAPRTDTGKISTDRETLRNSGDPELMLLASIGVADTLQRNILPNFRTPRGIVTPGYDGPKRSGRCSARKPNLQQVPRKGSARRCLVSREDCSLLSFDYQQLELCAFAQLCLDLDLGRDLADAINEGRDIHNQTGSEMARHGLEVPPAMARQIAKPVNFGRLGALGWRTLRATIARDCKVLLTEEQTKAIIAAHNAAFPSVDKYLKWAEAQHKAKYAATIRGSGRARWSDNWIALSNTRFQGLAADGALAALRSVLTLCYHPDLPLCGYAWPVLFVHDEIVIETQDEVCNFCTKTVAEEMKRVMQEHIPDVKIRVSVRKGKQWSK